MAHSIAHAPDCWILLDVQPKPGFSRKMAQGGFFCEDFNGSFPRRKRLRLWQLVADAMEKRILDIPTVHRWPAWISKERLPHKLTAVSFRARPRCPHELLTYSAGSGRHPVHSWDSSRQEGPSASRTHQRTRQRERERDTDRRTVTDSDFLLYIPWLSHTPACLPEQADTS